MKLISPLQQAIPQVKRVDAKSDKYGRRRQEDEFSNGLGFRQSLLDESDQPQPVLGVEIPKASGGTRQLGIPTVLDRIVQQAITSVPTEIYEPKFSDSSYGFRSNRSAHHTLSAASRYIREGRGYVVDIDLAKYFDTVQVVAEYSG